MRRTSGWIPVVIITAVSAAAAQQRDVAPAPSTRRVAVGTSTITGTVIDHESGRPVIGARVTVAGSAPSSSVRGAGPGPATGVVPGVTRGSVPPQVQVGLTMTMGPAQGGASSPVTAARAVNTDAQGQFTVPYLPSGSYSITVNHRSYLSGAHGQKKPGGSGVPLVVADGQSAETTIRMIRGGVITGMVYGEQGQPISGVQVTAHRYMYNNGVRRATQTNSASTDDRGLYRIFGLQPGEYSVSAVLNDGSFMDTSFAESELIARTAAAGPVQPPAAAGLPSTVAIPVVQRPPGVPSQPPGFLPTFYPSALAASGGSIVRVAGGDEHPGTDITLRQVRATNIAGVITNPPGGDMRVQVMASADDATSTQRFGTQASPDGRFTIMNLAPGSYTLTASTMVVRQGPVGPMTPAQSDAENAARLWGQTRVTVTGEESVAASLTLQPGRTISGHVTFEMARPPDLTRSTLQVRLVTAPGGPASTGPVPSGQIDAQGRFVLRGVPAGRYTLQVSGPFTKSVLVNGREILDDPLAFEGDGDLAGVVITVTDAVSEVTGTVTPAAGMSAPEYTVVVLPTDERYWQPSSRRILTARPSADGQYRLRGLPAGSYVMGLMVDFEPGSQFDPDVIKAILATPGVFLNLGDGERATRDLRAGGFDPVQ